MLNYLQKGQLHYKEHIWNDGQGGLEEFPKAFLGLMEVNII